MPELDPAMTIAKCGGPGPSNQPLVQILPIRIVRKDKLYFPSTRPMFQVLFPLDRGPDVIVLLGIDQPLQPIPRRESFDDSVMMLPRTTRKIAGHADIERAVWPVRYDVDPSTPHREFIASRRGLGNHDVDELGDDESWTEGVVPQ